MGLKNFLEKIEHHFEAGGKLEKYYPLYEAAATIFYTQGKVTPGASHVRECYRSETDDDSGVVRRIPCDVLGDV